MDSYDVRFWDTRKLGITERFRVRWAVDGREHCKWFKARPLADGFLAGLKDAVRDRRPFSGSSALEPGHAAEYLRHLTTVPALPHHILCRRTRLRGRLPYCRSPGLH